MQHPRGIQAALAEQLEIRRTSFLQALLMDSEETKPVIKLDDWEAEMQQQTVSREDLNELVMDYLVSEECKEAAEAFQEEANVHINRSHLLEARDQLNKRVNNHDAHGVIEILNKTNPKIIEELPQLAAELLLLELYSRIVRGQDVSEVFEFATEKVTQQVKEYPELEKPYELILSLLVIADPAKNSLSDRVQTWKANLLLKCKAALRKSESISLEPKLIKLLKLMKWMENRLGEKVTFPTMVNLESGVLELPKEVDRYALLTERLSRLQRPGQ